jgi:hypothetical protein
LTLTVLPARAALFWYTAATVFRLASAADAPNDANPKRAANAMDKNFIKTPVCG